MPPPQLRRYLLVAFALILPLTARAQGYLHTSGQYIVDGNNLRVLLRGMGLGGWLVPEGYMLQTASFASSPTAIRNAVVDLVGEANADQFFALYRQKFVRRKDIDSLALWGFNSVRLPMHYALLSPTRGVYSDAGFAIIDSLLAWCAADSIYLILDLHCAPGGQNKDNISDYQGPPSLWESDAYQAWTAELWKALASRYRNEPWIGGYDLLNEPAWSFPSGNKPLRDLLVRITDSIRTVDRHHIIFAEGNWYATDFSGLAPAWDNTMAWSFHKYWNVNDYNSLLSFLTLRSDTGIPLWLGESGENSNHWFGDAIRMLELNGIGWSWWTLKKIESISCPLSVTKHPGYDALLRYWNGQAPRPTVDAAMQALTEQALLLDAELCTRRPDFLDALFVMPLADTRRPYRRHTLPGTVHAVDYDMGRNLTSYKDADFQYTQGPGGGTAYNQGWSYRNDGVDIERSQDAAGNGYNVGWINEGEYLRYSVEVQTGGIYRITVSASSGAAGGTMSLYWDGSTLTGPVNVPPTGGWQNWVSLDAGTHHLAAGSHDLEVRFITSGTNLSRLQFELISAGVASNETTPRQYALEQNFPNPFNPSTTIAFELPHSSQVTLTLYNVLGVEMAEPVRGVLGAGRHESRIDARGLPSGVYLCRLRARPVSGAVTAEFVQTRRMLLLR